MGACKVLNKYDFSYFQQQQKGDGEAKFEKSNNTDIP